MRGIDGKPPMPRNRKKKESFNLENGFPNRPLVRLRGAGHYYAVEAISSSSGGGQAFHHYPCTSLEALTEKVMEIDREGGTAFFACASYRSESILIEGRPRYRVEENQLAAKSLWLDIDAGLLIPSEI